MNRDEIIKHVRYILKHRSYDLTKKELKLARVDYNWAVTFISDSLPCPKEEAENILINEVFHNITLIVEGGQGRKKAPKGYITIDELHKKTGIARNTLNYWVKNGYMHTTKYQGIRIIADEEANACVINFRRKQRNRHDVL